MTRATLPYTYHRIEEPDIAAVVEVLRHGALTGGPAVERLEAAFRAETGARHAVACSSGTAALHLAMAALGIGAGDKVVVPSITFLATANAVRFVGADVVFADVDPDLGLMRPVDLEAALLRAGGKVAAVIPVHLGGQCCDMPGIHDIAHTAGLRIVEDACHALGTEVAGLAVGACRLSDMSMFSLHPAKIVAMGEGGVLTTGDPALAERARQLRNHGMTRDPARFGNRDLALDADGRPNPWYYEMPEIGFNYRASDILCALGASQLARLKGNKTRRKQLAERYDRLLASLSPTVRPVPMAPDCRPVRHLYPVLIDFEAIGKDRATLMRALRDHGIDTQVHYIPVHLQPYYRALAPGLSLPGAEHYYAQTLSLPFFHGMAFEDADRVVAALTNCL